MTLRDTTPRRFLIDEVRAHQRLPQPSEARAIRLAAGVTQTRLADELGVHRLTIARWESGRRNPVGPHRAAYAELLDALRTAVAFLRPTG